MRLIIHRGSHEIGGSCVELKSRCTRIIIDIGMPIIEKSGERFNFQHYRNLSGEDLINERILPDVKGLYRWDTTNKPIDGLLISHAHINHYGFYNYLNEDIPYYLGEGTKRLIDLSALFLGYNGVISHYSTIRSGEPIKIGDFKITPYLMDHSAFDAYAFLIEANGKKILYSGDFREHGRKAKAFRYFLSHIPEGADALLLEGSTLGRDNSVMRTEQDIEDEIVDVINKSNTIVFGISSSQNIDRLVSFYKATLRTKRIFAIDVYTANILDSLKDLGAIPYPSSKFSNIRVFFPRSICNKIAQKNRQDLMYKLKQFKITKKEISDNASKVVMMVKPSMTFDLSRMEGIESATVIYSLWEGYLKDRALVNFLAFLEKKGMKRINLHTSGHASINTLKKVVAKINPKRIIPIHTFHPDKYKELFEANKVLKVTDFQEVSI